MLCWFVLLGAITAGWIGAVGMVFIFGPLYLYGAYERAKCSERLQKRDAKPSAAFCEFCQQPDGDPPAMLAVCPACWTSANEGSGWMQRALTAEAENAELKQAIRDRLEPVFAEQQGIVEELRRVEKASE